MFHQFSLTRLAFLRYSIAIIFIAVAMRISLIICLVIVIRRKDVEAAGSEDHKRCTEYDQRRTYPSCMWDKKNLSMWCDQSKYTKVPSVEEISKNLPHVAELIPMATALYLNDSCITEISSDDLKLYSNITTLDISVNQLGGIEGSPFRRNQRLQAIILQHNQIQSIKDGNFKDLRNLETINLQYNKIHEISRFSSDQGNLRTLLLDGNELAYITDCPFYFLKGLKHLSLTKNRINHIGDDAFDGAESLTHLQLETNKLEEINCKGFKDLGNLQVLTLSHNRIKKWPQQCEHLRNLETLDLSHNILEIGDGDKFRMPNLKLLNLMNNSIYRISEHLLRLLDKLEELDLSHNFITEVTSRALTRLSNLKTLKLNDNRLETPYKEWFNGNVNPLLHLDLSRNEWHCDCSAIKYQEYVEDLEKRGERRNSGSESRIQCNSPREHKGRFLKDILLDCPISSTTSTTTTTTTNTTTTTSTYNIVTSTQWEQEISTRIGVMHKTALPMVQRNSGSDKDNDKTRESMSVILIGTLIASSLIILSSIFACCKLKRQRLKMHRSANQEEVVEAEPEIPQRSERRSDDYSRISLQFSNSSSNRTETTDTLGSSSDDLAEVQILEENSRSGLALKDIEPSNSSFNAQNCQRSTDEYDSTETADERDGESQRNSSFSGLELKQIQVLNSSHHKNSNVNSESLHSSAENLANFESNMNLSLPDLFTSLNTSGSDNPPSFFFVEDETNTTPKNVENSPFITKRSDPDGESVVSRDFTSPFLNPLDITEPKQVAELC